MMWVQQRSMQVSGTLWLHTCWKPSTQSLGNQNWTPRNLAIVTGGKAFAFSSWWDCCCISNAARRAAGVTPLTLGDFHHADVRAAGYKFCMALGVWRSSGSTGWGWTSIPELGTSSAATAHPSTRGCTCLATPEAPETCMSSEEQADGKHRIIPHKKPWFTTIGCDFFFLKLSDFMVWMILWLLLR